MQPLLCSILDEAVPLPEVSTGCGSCWVSESLKILVIHLGIVVLRIIAKHVIAISRIHVIMARSVIIAVIVSRPGTQLEGSYLGSCQNYGPFLGTLNIRCRIIVGIQKGTIILTTTHLGAS